MKRFHVVVPTVLAIMALVAGLRAATLEPFAANEHVVESAPTPYSTSHAIVQSRPGEPEEQPPTF